MSTTTFPVLRTADFADMAHLDLLDRVVTIETAPLTLVSGSYGHVTLAEVEAGAPMVEVNLSADGRYFGSMWHTTDDGPEAEWVYVERWTNEGRVFHGFVDSVSRKILQSG